MPWARSPQSRSSPLLRIFALIEEMQTDLTRLAAEDHLDIQRALPLPYICDRNPPVVIHVVFEAVRIFESGWGLGDFGFPGEQDPVLAQQFIGKMDAEVHWRHDAYAFFV